MLFHTILFLKTVCITVLKEKNMIGWKRPIWITDMRQFVTVKRLY